MNALVMSVIYSICFGLLLGYINDRYQIAMYRREIGSWQALASSNILGIFVGMFRVIKWYSWIFYSFLGLLFIAGIIMQVFIFCPLRASRFFFMFAGALQIMGSLLFVASWTSERIISKIRSMQKEETNGKDYLKKNDS
jgi:hypothetical protein